MIYYRFRKGVVLTSICGEYLLVATPEARSYCERIRQINETGADIVVQLLNGAGNIDEIINGLQDEYEITNTIEFREKIQVFLDDLIKKGYVIIEEHQD